MKRRDVLKYAASAPVLLSLPTVPLLSAPRAQAESPVAGRIVFLDPGHNGANDASINDQVTNGRGGTKECQTTGTSTDAGYPEHSFNWDVVLRIREMLTAMGVRTALSRGNDNALGPWAITRRRWRCASSWALTARISSFTRSSRLLAIPA